MMRLSLGLGLVLSLVAVGCGEGSSSGASPSTTGSAAATGAAKPTAAAQTAAAATAEAKPAEPASAAAAFPATDIPAKDFAGLTIGVPPGGKVDKSGDDRASVETADYKLMVKKAGPKDEDVAELKAMIQKMPGFKSITVDKPDGLVIEVEEKGKPQFVLTRIVKAGDLTLLCDSALTKPPTDKAKAQEAFDVCGTIKKK